MSCLEATFTLTPRSPSYSNSAGAYAELDAHGVDFSIGSDDLPSLYATNRFLFEGAFASDPDLDYTQWSNIKRARALSFYVDLTTYAGSPKQLAVVFGFDVPYSPVVGSAARVLVYSYAGLLSDQTLEYGDSQLLLEIESLIQPVHLYFIHASASWYFRGLSGYLV
jgi:hypothetical protein